MYWSFWYTLFCFWLINFSSALNSAWRWECIDNYCVKNVITNETEANALSLAVCRLQCSEYAAIWPKPTGVFLTETSRTVHTLNVNNITMMSYAEKTVSSTLFNSAKIIFQQQIFNLTKRNISIENGKQLLVKINVEDASIYRLTLSTNESYTLNITNTNEVVNVDISANNFFGARHALTTLSQLIVFDDLRDQIAILSNVYISDGPAYSYRGILLDTSRSYIKIDVIKSILRGMGASKLNHFHWHITDSQSFPFVSNSYPDLSKYGAYSPSQVYTASMIQEIVDYALERGVRVLPELDTPAHVGEGWQNTGYVTCFNWQPYRTYCMQPPCGQFDPTQDGLYDMLGDQGFNVIISNFNALYLDCGYGSWYNDGDGYCSYNSWKRIYGHTPEAVAGARKTQVVGTEVAFWSEQGGSEAAETRIWPRAAALAEVAWSEPAIDSWIAAEQRFLVQWERLIQHGVKCDAPQPEWCSQNEENCRIGSHFYNISRSNK